MRIATFNILHGRAPEDGRVDLERFADAVAALDADVLALQEVDRDQPRSHGADLTALAARASGAPEHRFAATLAGTPDVWTAATGDLQPRAAAYGIALLSRFPVREWRTLALPALRGRTPVVFPGRRRPVLVRDEPRAALVAVVETPQGDLTVAATHLTFIPAWNAVQLRRLVGRLPRSGPAVLLGDLNLDAPRPARITGWRSLVDAETYPVETPTRQLDHVLGRGPVRATGGGVAVATGLSDHRALSVEVSLTQ